MTYDAEHLLKLATTYYEECLHSLVKIAFIKKLPGGKWRVLSQKGKSLGTYDTKEKAVERLRQVEYFKEHKDNDKAEDQSVIDLTDADDLTYSAIMRKMRKKANPEQVRKFLTLFKLEFDKAVKKKLQKPEKVALQNSLVKFNKLYKIKLKKKLVKNATVSELGDPSVVGKYLADIVNFTLRKLPADKRASAIESLRTKFYSLHAGELANKNFPDTASIGQSITFVKHILFNHDEAYIREVLNNLSRNL